MQTKAHVLFDEGFNLCEWHVDLQTQYVTHFPSDIGFSVAFKTRRSDSHEISARDFIAEPIHFAAWGDVASDTELARLSLIAAALFAQRFAHRRDNHSKRKHPHLSEDET